ncbi:NAD(P)/FAD-dependent oxidoreductase [Streptomyces flavofungini]|uniref:NAD(P)/FAD-dependent oxidoreductase n=1 Tax=Streptomyces flavofungini TaxID=68200 RepID=UPI0034DE4D2E
MSVVVVGAGIVGSSVAYHLARRGVPVTLLDQGPAPATGVTGGSFAWIGDRGRQWPGGARHLRGSVLADHRRLEAELPGIAVRWTGSLAWTGDGTERDSRPRPGQSWIGGADVAALEPHLRHPPEWALHTPSDGGVDPVALTHALVDGARAHGATVLHRTVVTSLQSKRTGSRVEGVRSSTGFHPAATVVLAAGTGVPALCEPVLAGLPVAVSPACLVRLSAPSGLVRSIVARPDIEVREVREGHLLLVVPPPAEQSANAGERAAYEGLRRVRSLFRGGEECRLLDHRVSGRPMPAHGPIIGYATRDRSVYVAVTHSAVTLAPTVGRLVADELATGAPAPELRGCRPGTGPGTALAPNRVN